MEPIKLQTEIDALISITERMKASVADGEIKLVHTYMSIRIYIHTLNEIMYSPGDKNY